MRVLLDEGYRRSVTFRDLANQLERSDLIVFVIAGTRLPHGCAAGLEFLARRGHQRYMRIVVDARLRHDESIAAIAHELQHATEVAHAPDVTDEASFLRLYNGIGLLDGRGHTCTDAARDITVQVLAELRTDDRPATGASPP